VIWVSNEALDALMTRDSVRVAWGLCTYPKTRAELRLMMKALRDAGQSYGDMAETLQSNFIPTAAGLKQWHRPNIPQYLKGTKDGDVPLEPAEECFPPWRRYAAERLILELTRGDSLAPVKYRMRVDVQEDCVRILGDLDLHDHVNALFPAGSWGTVYSDELEPDDGTHGQEETAR
jgi:hypothetical protein